MEDNLKMIKHCRLATRRLLVAFPVVGVLAIVSLTNACSKQTSRSAQEDSGKAPNVAQAKGDPGIDLNCVYEHLKNPPESFHYLYKKDTSDGANVHQEADLTPQTVDGFRMQPDGTQQPLHAARSDSSAWQAALTGLTGISGMAGTVATFNHSSAVQRESDGGQVNGYQTTHYSIDTARWDATTRQLLGNSTLGPGGFDKGDAWVTSEGCPVKLVLDDEMHKKDGSLLEKVHYEEAMVKK
jgi:hypothetical protein